MKMYLTRLTWRDDEGVTRLTWRDDEGVTRLTWGDDEGVTSLEAQHLTLVHVVRQKVVALLGGQHPVDVALHVVVGRRDQPEHLPHQQDHVKTTNYTTAVDQQPKMDCYRKKQKQELFLGFQIRG